MLISQEGEPRIDTDKLLVIKNLEVNYKTDKTTVHAVNGISLELGKGETVGLVGETGAGKTTTALAILRLLPEVTAQIPHGEIYFDGENLLQVTEERMRHIRGDKISMIFQDPMTALNPVYTVGEQIYEAIELHSGEHKSREQINERVDEVLKMVGITPERKVEYPHQFSGGMKQRVVIAMALACEPELLIADEPTTALDVTIQAQVLIMMRELRDRLGTAMIMITHDLGIVAQTCDKVAVMYAGELIETGSAEDIYNSGKRHPYTEGLFGSIPNLTEDTDRLKPIPGLMPDPTDLPAGCYFSPRCPFATDKCRSQHPPVYREGDHQIACWRFAEEEQ
ncbi:MAG: ABC transporter ATP-binding protein [Lachnospiraceae bacterium]|nr:ABC transporter ATP-binding protein [Lachnospiraceae bacterium]